MQEEGEIDFLAPSYYTALVPTSYARLAKKVFSYGYPGFVFRAKSSSCADLGSANFI